MRVTMGYYANVDDAVEEAILGPRVSSRGTGQEPAPEAAGPYYGKSLPDKAF